MFISIVGTRASGKSSVEQYLVSTCNFQPVRLVKDEDKHSSSRGMTPQAKSRNTLGLKESEISASCPSHHVQVGKVNGHAITTPILEEKVPEPIYFETPTLLLGYVTEHWLESFVTCDLDTPRLIKQFHKRPFFLLVFVDAPLLTRYRRLTSLDAPNLTLQEFVNDHDASFYGHRDPRLEGHVDESRDSLLQDMFRLANVHVVNSDHTLGDLHVRLRELNLSDPDRLRPSWDTYFMTLAELASRRSNCMKRRVGALLVRDKRIVATGYNGTPRYLTNCNEGGCRRCNTGGPSGEALDECLCLHAEENALLEAGRERVGVGAVLYCNTCPCLGCAIKIVQAGVKEVVYNLSYKLDNSTAALFEEAGVILRQYSPPQYLPICTY